MRGGGEVATDVSVVIVDPRLFLHVHFGGNEELLAWFEKDAEEAGEAPEEHAIWLIEEYRKAVQGG